MKTGRILRMVPLAYLLAVPLALASFTLEARSDPSFDCSRASSEDERAICDDPKLAAIDVLVADAYRSFAPQFQPRKSVARHLLADRRACGGDTVCIAAAQFSALSTYGNIEPWVQNYVVSEVSARASQLANGKQGASKRMPDQVGECVETRISNITTRFGDPVDYSNMDAGTSVEYANGGRVVSYDRGQGLFDAKAGQRAVLCLLTIPYDCPAGDDRGRLYYTLDVDTKGEWILTDTQHMCGGA